jgi:succinate dehydrogenase hydrophobic anchor subunit
MVTKSENNSKYFNTFWRRSWRQTLRSSLLRGFFHSVWISNLPYMCHVSHPANTECISNLPWVCHMTIPASTVYTSNTLYVCHVTHPANTVCISNLSYVYHMIIEANIFWLDYFTVKTKRIYLRTLCFISLHILMLYTPLYLQKYPHINTVIRHP